LPRRLPPSSVSHLAERLQNGSSGAVRDDHAEEQGTVERHAVPDGEDGDTSECRPSRLEELRGVTPAPLAGAVRKASAPHALGRDRGTGIDTGHLAQVQRHLVGVHIDATDTEQHPPSDPTRRARMHGFGHLSPKAVSATPATMALSATLNTGQRQAAMKSTT